MNTSELQLPKKIFPVEYAGFFDFNEEGIYDTSVINRDDYPNAEQIANEISKRYNNFEKMKEALEYALSASDDYRNYDPFKAETAKQLLESLK